MEQLWAPAQWQLLERPFSFPCQHQTHDAENISLSWLFNGALGTNSHSPTPGGMSLPVTATMCLMQDFRVAKCGQEKPAPNSRLRSVEGWHLQGGVQAKP